MRTTETYSVISDVELPSHDATVRMYWTGAMWDQDSTMSTDRPTLKEIDREALMARHYYPDAEIKILRIRSSMDSEVIEWRCDEP